MAWHLPSKNKRELQLDITSKSNVQLPLSLAADRPFEIGS